MKKASLLLILGPVVGLRLFDQEYWREQDWFGGVSRATHRAHHGIHQHPQGIHEIQVRIKPKFYTYSL